MPSHGEKATEGKKNWQAPSERAAHRKSVVEWKYNTKSAPSERGEWKTEARTSTVLNREKKLFVREFCYSHYSIPLLYSFFLLLLGFVGSKLFSELGGFRCDGTRHFQDCCCTFFLLFSTSFFFSSRESGRTGEGWGRSNIVFTSESSSVDVVVTGWDFPLLRLVLSPRLLLSLLCVDVICSSEENYWEGEKPVDYIN